MSRDGFYVRFYLFTFDSSIRSNWAELERRSFFKMNIEFRRFSSGVEPVDGLKSFAVGLIRRAYRMS